MSATITNAITIPPCSPEAEQKTLGAMLAGPDPWGDPVNEVREILPPDLDWPGCPGWFYDPNHNTIYNAMHAIREQGDPVTIGTLCGRLRRTGKLEAIGGREYIEEIARSVVSAADAKGEAREVRNKALQRWIWLVGNGMQWGSDDPNKPVSVNVEQAIERLSRIAGLVGSGSSGGQIQLITAKEIMHRPPPQQIVVPYVPEKSTGVLFGPPEAGKTLVAVSIGCSLVTGTQWLGKYPVSQGAVVYITGEGQGAFGKRLNAWLTWYQMTEDVLANWYGVERAVDVCNPHVVDELADIITRTVGEQRIRLVVLDTLARSMGAGDENATKDMNQLVAGVDSLRDKIGASVLLIHHSGRMDAGRARGSSVLDAAADVMYKLEVTDDVMVMSCTKSKDFERPKPLYLRRVVIDLPDGSTSCTVIPHESPRRMFDQHEERLLEVLAENTAGVTWTWFMNRSGLCKSLFSPALRHLMDSGHVIKSGTGRKVRYYPAMSSDESIENTGNGS